MNPDPALSAELEVATEFAQMAEALQSKFGNNRTQSHHQTGGVRVAAQVLNNLPQNMSKSILTSLSERDAELGEAILAIMFTFEELRQQPRY